MLTNRASLAKPAHWGILAKSVQKFKALKSQNFKLKHESVLHYTVGINNVFKTFESS